MKKKILMLIILPLALNACVLAPFIQSFKEIGVTEADRIVLFEKTMKDFEVAWQAGRLSRVLRYADESNRDSLSQLLRKSKKNEKVVDITVDDVAFNEDAREADAEVIVKYYEVPYYVVNERIEMEKWIFTVNTGWRLKSKEVLSSGLANTL